MAAIPISFRRSRLPWAGSRDDDARFNRIFVTVLAISIAVSLVMPWIPVPKPDREHPQELPPRLAKLLLDTPRTPLPAQKAEPVPAVAAPQPKTESPKPEPPKAVPKGDREKAPVPEARRPIEGKPPGEIGEARRRAAGVGLLAMKDDIAELRGAPVAAQLKADIKPGPGVGTTTGPGVGAGTEAGVPVRSLITSNATNGSGGINTAGFSRNTGGGGLAGRSTTLVEGVAGGGGGGGPGGGGGAGGNGRGGAGGAGGSIQRGANSGKASRSLEEIKLVFDRNKGSIYALYNRALREDPTLEGKVVLELKIAPSGEVVECHIVSSELKAADLERKLLARVRQFDFGAKDVEQMTVTWPVDFLPS